MIRFIDLFCGIRGFRLGLERANQKIRQFREWTRGSRCSRPKWDSSFSEGDARQDNKDYYQCVWANDNDKYACQISRRHYPNDILVEGDIRTVDVDGIPEHDLLCAGFPCQSFSIAGKRGGFEDTRGTLFFEICRVIRVKRPGYLLLENVKGLLSHDDGSTFETIIGTLDELGYGLQWQVLNSKDYGVPQNRERVFIIGHFRGKPRPKVFPIGETDKAYYQSYEGGSKVPPTGQNTQSPNGQPQPASGDSRFNASPDEDLATCLDANYGKGWLDHGQRTMIYDIYNQQLRANQEIAGALKGEGIADTSLGTALILRDGRDNRSCLREGRTLELGIKGQSIRRLTPLECERLQGFPDGWTEGISDTQRYKCLGNAVTVNVIEAIGRQLIDGLS